MIIGVGLSLVSTVRSPFAANLKSGDGYIRREDSRWVIGTAMVEKTISLNRGSLTLTSFKNKASQREYVQGGVASAEIRLTANGEDITGSYGNWTLVREDSHQTSQGELQLELTLRHGPLEVSKHYVVYPGTSVIREWISISNASEKPVRISDPFFLESHFLSSDVDKLELYYVTGGGAYNGSQLLKMDRMTPDYARIFDSYDPSDTGPRGLSYSAYLPLLVLYNPQTRDGLMAGWDYLGHWVLNAGNYGGNPVSLSIKVGGYSRDLEPGKRIETPKAFTGIFKDDLDAMGNLLLDWQYQYLWEFTNQDYFAKTRWAVDWPEPWVGTGGLPSADNWGRRLALDLRYIDLMRRTGGDILWDDAGWYDKWGSWNGPEWRLTNDYLAKHGMKWVLWYPTFLATRDSEVGQEHPDWLIPRQQALEQSIPETAAWQRDLLDKGVAAWGDFQWRYDIAPAVSSSDTDYLESDQNFRGLLQRFKETHKGSGVDACYGGGRWISYDLARLSESGEYTDGGVGPYSSYYSSLLVPPDKLHNVVDFDHTYYDPGSDRTHLCMNPTWYRDPGDGPDLEAIRKDWEIYHYLVAQGVAGRWSHVFRPAVKNDDPIWYFQRMNRDGTKGIIIAKHSKNGPTYYLINKPVGHTANETSYYGGPWNMCKLSSTPVASIDTGVYQDPRDGRYRFYGVPGEAYGPLNFKYGTPAGEASYVTAVVKLGGRQAVKDRSFGMAIQVHKEPVTITQLGLYGGDNNQGSYALMVVRAEDDTILGSANLDMSQGNTDALGFKYVRLQEPIRLDTSPDRPVVTKPRGLTPGAMYDVRCAKSDFQAERSGSDLMDNGIEIGSIEAGELIFLNLPNYPGSGQDKTPPTPPIKVTKRIGTNLGVQGIEITWLPGSDDNWVSYYEVLRDGSLLDRVAKGTFFFYDEGNARDELQSRYEVRTVDGDGHRSSSVAAQEVRGEPETYRALGGFSPTQGANQWRYEEAMESGSFRHLKWDSGGYEGRWVGSGLTRIGRIWMQPGMLSDVARAFVAPAKGVLTISGSIRKDPSSENGRSVQARILHNDRQIWPMSGWAEITSVSSKEVSYRLENIAVEAGDRVRFVLQRTGLNTPDTVIWDPLVVISRRK
jgi:hypothetical protein